MDCSFCRALCLVVAVVFAQTLAVADEWTRFRGPQGTGIGAAPGLPLEWTAKDIAWETILPGVGHSSPVVHANQVFVTSASEDGTARQLHCLNASTGEIDWTEVLTLKSDTLHAKNSHASGTPVLSQGRVIAAFADDDRFVVAAYRFDGTEAWTRDLGPFESQHGHGASPIVWRDLVIVPNDQDGESFLAALDVSSGEIVWKSPRPSKDASYSTPFILESAGKAPQLIASCNAMGVTSLDPATGTLNWQSGPLPQRTVGSPVLAGNVILQSCGQGGRGTLLVGVDPFAASDDKRVVFEETKLLPYVPTPIAHNGYIYLWNDNGVVICMDGRTHQPVWTERVGGKYSASPICVNGHLYGVSEEGEVVVIKASPEFQLLGRSLLGDFSHATPAVANGRLFFRTFHKVICLAAKAK